MSQVSKPEVPEVPKVPIGPILVASDFSPVSKHAVRWAIRASRSFEAQLLVLHVVHDPEAAPGYYSRSEEGASHLVRMEETAAEMMESFMKDLRDEYPGDSLGFIETRLVVGLPVNRILEVAVQVDACQIVLGSLGRTGLPHLLLGSNALRVAQLAPIPVTIIKGHDL